MDLTSLFEHFCQHFAIYGVVSVVRYSNDFFWLLESQKRNRWVEVRWFLLLVSLPQSSESAKIVLQWALSICVCLCRCLCLSVFGGMFRFSATWQLYGQLIVSFGLFGTICLSSLKHHVSKKYVCSCCPLIERGNWDLTDCCFLWAYDYGVMFCALMMMLYVLLLLFCCGFSFRFSLNIVAAHSNAVLCERITYYEKLKYFSFTFMVFNSHLLFDLISFYSLAFFLFIIIIIIIIIFFFFEKKEDGYWNQPTKVAELFFLCFSVMNNECYVSEVKKLTFSSSYALIFDQIFFFFFDLWDVFSTDFKFFFLFIYFFNFFQSLMYFSSNFFFCFRNS